MPSVQENNQIPSIGGTHVNETTVADTVKKPAPDVPTTSSVEADKIVNSTAREIQGTLASAGELAVSQGEQQSVSVGNMKVTVHTSDKPQANPVPGSSFGQIPGVLSAPATGDLQSLQIPLSSSPFGQMHTLHIPYVAGAPNSYLPVLLPPCEAVLPSVATSSQMFQFQQVVALSSGQLNVLPSAGAPVQLHAVVPPTGDFVVVNSDTSQQLNFTSPTGSRF
jgi:hypothetical protein